MIGEVGSGGVNVVVTSTHLLTAAVTTPPAPPPPPPHPEGKLPPQHFSANQKLTEVAPGLAWSGFELGWFGPIQGKTMSDMLFLQIGKQFTF